MGRTGHHTKYYEIFNSNYVFVRFFFADFLLNLVKLFPFIPKAGLRCKLVTISLKVSWKASVKDQFTRRLYETAIANWMNTFHGFSFSYNLNWTKQSPTNHAVHPTNLASAFLPLDRIVFPESSVRATQSASHQIKKTAKISFFVTPLKIVSIYDEWYSFLSLLFSVKASTKNPGLSFRKTT